MDDPFLVAYREKFVELIRTNSTEVYSNHSRLHAGIIIQELIRHAENYLYIQCSNFASDIYGNKETQRLLKNAIERNVCVKIAVRNEPCEKDFADELNKMKEDTVIRNLSVSENDFCVTAPYRYRRETDKKKGVAEVCANGKEVAEDLVNSFVSHFPELRCVND